VRLADEINRSVGDELCLDGIIDERGELVECER
jgi:hypothetical protein